MHPGAGACAQRNEPVFAALALPDHQGAALHIHLVQLQSNQLASSDAAGVQGFQNRPVTDTTEGLGVRAVDDVLHLLDGEQVLGQAPGRFDDVQVSGRIGQDVPLAREPFEEGQQGLQPCGLGAVGQGVAVFLASEVQVALVALQHRAGDFTGVADAALIGPGDEVHQGAVTDFGGGWGQAHRHRPVTEACAPGLQRVGRCGLRCYHPHAAGLLGAQHGLRFKRLKQIAARASACMTCARVQVGWCVFRHTHRQYRPGA